MKEIFQTDLVYGFFIKYFFIINSCNFVIELFVKKDVFVKLLLRLILSFLLNNDCLSRM